MRLPDCSRVDTIVWRTVCRPADHLFLAGPLDLEQVLENRQSRGRQIESKLYEFLDRHCVAHHCRQAQVRD